MQCLQTARIQLITVIFSQHLSDKYEAVVCCKIFVTAGYVIANTFVVVRGGGAAVSVVVNNKRERINR